MDRSLLIVEDDPAIAAGLRDFLQSENYRVAVCGDGEAAIEVAMREHPDLVLLDVSLPKIGGIDVCRELRRRDFDRPIIMLTSRSELLDKVVALEAGADDYMTKPFELRELLARIRAQARRVESAPAAAPYLDGSGLRRRLLAVMFSDIVGYSRQMHADEVRGLEMLRRHNRIVDACVVRFGGRVVEIVGDAYLVTFESAGAAVDCAVEAQRELRAEAIGVRIGVHVGDVIEVDGGVKGDVVNLARRIQEEAGEGTVTVSEAVRLIVHARAAHRFEALGLRALKNIEEPVALHVVCDGDSRRQPPGC